MSNKLRLSILNRLSQGGNFQPNRIICLFFSGHKQRILHHCELVELFQLVKDIAVTGYQSTSKVQNVREMLKGHTKKFQYETRCPKRYITLCVQSMDY